MKNTQDGFQNIINSLNFNNFFDNPVIVNEVYTTRDYESAYKNNALIKKIVNRIPFDGMKKQFKINNLDEDVHSVLETKLKDLNVNKKLEEAWVQSRIYGQSYILVVTNEETDNYSNEIQQSEILQLQVFSDGVNGQMPTREPESKNFGLPSKYNISDNYFMMTDIHYTRILRFDGEYIPQSDFITNNYKNASLIHKLYKISGQYETAHKALAPLVHAYNTKILKLENLMDIADAKTEASILKRIEATNQTIAKGNTIFLTQGDEYSNNSINLSGLDKIIEQFDNRLVAASGIPRNILFGDSPKGMQSNGSSELSDYYDTVRQEQIRVLQPNIKAICDQILKYEFGKLFNYDIEFPAIEELNELEEAEYRLKTAQTMAIHLENGILSEEEVRSSLFSNKYTNEIVLQEEDLDN